MAKKLTVRGLDAIETPATRREVPDGLVSGLYLILQPSGKRSWAVRYRSLTSGVIRTRKHTLGSASAIGLVEARDLARAALVEVAKGNDPAAAKKAARNAKPKLTVAELLSVYIEKYAKKQTKAATAHETERALKKELEHLGPRPAEMIVRRDIMNIIDDHVTDGQVATAIRVRALISKMFNWAVEEEYLPKSPCVNLTKIKAPDSVERNLSAEEIFNVIKFAYLYDFPFGSYLRFLLCTGQRRTMTAETKWQELNGTTSMWTIPKTRMKNKRDHFVHLSGYAREVLRDLRAHNKVSKNIAISDSEFVFANQDGKPISGFSDRKAAFDEFMRENGCVIEPWTLHDLRRTASTSMSELGVEQVVIDLILSHQTGRTKDVGFIYNRNQQLKKRKEALDRWGDYLSHITPWQGPVDRGAYGEERDAEGKL